MKLTGGTILYALMLTMLFTMISSAMIMAGYFYRQSSHYDKKIIKAWSLANSGIELLMSAQPPLEIGHQLELNLFEEEGGEVILSRDIWGGYELIGSAAFQYKGKQVLKQALIGHQPLEEEHIALYMADRNKPLSLGGETLIKGLSYLPKSGVKRAYIEGQSFSGKRLINGPQQLSKKYLPPLNITLVEACKAQMRNPQKDADSMVHFFDELSVDSITRPFHRSSVILYAPGPILLDRIQLKGRIIVTSETEITVAQGAILEDVLVIAPRIVIHDGVNGTGQFMAQDSLLIGQEVDLGYPSLLALFPTTGVAHQAQLRMGERSRVSGTMLFSGTGSRRHIGPGIVMEDEAQVTGEVYAEAQVELKGKIFGSLYCNGFYLKTPSSVYDNHLLNAVIDAESLSEAYAGMGIMDVTGPKKVVKWLY